MDGFHIICLEKILQRVDNSMSQTCKTGDISSVDEEHWKVMASFTT